jgi:ethanolamine transporter EutH
MVVRMVAMSVTAMVVMWGRHVAFLRAVLKAIVKAVLTGKMMADGWVVLLVAYLAWNLAVQ